MGTIESYRNQFEQASQGILIEQRQRAFDHFLKCGLPTRQVEHWKYSDIVNKLHQASYLNISSQGFDLINNKLTPDDGVQLDYIELDNSSDHPLLLKYFGSLTSSRHPFANIALASATRLLVLTISRDIQSMIELRQILQHNTYSTDYCLIVIEPSVSAKLTIDSLGSDDSACFANQVVEIVLGDNSHLTLYNHQQLNDHSLLTQAITVHQASNSSFNSFTFDHGGQMVRRDIDVELLGANATCDVSGFYQAILKQHVDNHSVINHRVPHCQSNEFYKGVIADQARAVFNGKIIIHKDAQKTVTSQRNNNILLSSLAEVDTKPELEIYADDVKANHGATVGQLDEQALFYVQSRGLTRDQAYDLLIQAFIKEVFDKISDDSLRLQWLNILGCIKGDEDAV